MRAYQIEQQFGLNNLRLTLRSDPCPGPGQVHLRMKAVSLNYRDLLVVQGHYNPKQRLPLIPCSDGVGVVEAVGEGVTRVVPGQRVCPIFCQSWVAGEPSYERLRSTLGSPLDGCLREAMVLDEQAVVPVPEHLSDVQAACLPCAALTAWSALVTRADLSPGDTVLLLGTGGVSIFALQFAQVQGLRTIVTSSSQSKLERAARLGADETINYREQPDWGKQARDLTGGRGVDLVVEVGGAATLEQSLAAVRLGGQVSLIGVLSGTTRALNVLPILMKQVRVQGILVGNRDGFEAMNRAISMARLEPVVDRVFPFEQSRQAFEYLAGAGHLGKVCIQVEEG